MICDEDDIRWIKYINDQISEPYYLVGMKNQEVFRIPLDEVDLTIHTHIGRCLHCLNEPIPVLPKIRFKIV